MATIASLNVNVGANSSPFDRTMAGVRKQLRGMQADADQSISGLASGSLPKLASSLTMLANPATAAVVALTAVTAAAAAAGTAVVGAAVAGIKLAADFEKAETSFTTLYKSAAVAKDVIAEIKEFAAETPFEFPELQAAGTKLAGFGVAASEIVPTMHMLGDLAAGVGANVGELAETYGKARIQGRAYTKDVNELANRGVPIWDALAKSQGKSIAEIHAMVEEGSIGFKELQGAMIGLTSAGGQFEGGLAAQSKTLHGLASTLKDNVNMALAEFGQHLVQDLDLKGAMTELVEFTNVLSSDLAPAMGQAVGLLVEFGRDAADFVQAMGGPEVSLKALTEGIVAFHMGILKASHAWHSFKGDFVGAEKDLAAITALMLKPALGRGKSAGRNTPKLEGGGDDAARDAAVALTGDVGKLTAELKEQAATYGMAATEAKLWKLATAGATVEQLAEARAAAGALDAVKKHAEETARATKEAKAGSDAIGNLAADLRKQIEAFGESTEAQKLWKLEQQNGATAATEEARALVEQLDALREQKKALEDAAKAQQELRDEAKKVFEETRTPREKAEAEMQRLKKLWEAGLIDDDTAQRAGDKVREQLADTKGGKTNADKLTTPAALRGSAEAFSSINRAGNGRDGEAKKTRLEQLKEAVRQTRYLQKLEEAASGGQNRIESFS